MSPNHEPVRFGVTVPYSGLSPCSFSSDSPSSNIMTPSPGSCGRLPGVLLHPLGFGGFFVPEALRDAVSETLREELDTVRPELDGLR